MSAPWPAYQTAVCPHRLEAQQGQLGEEVLLTLELKLLADLGLCGCAKCGQEHLAQGPDKCQTKGYLFIRTMLCCPHRSTKQHTTNDNRQTKPLIYHSVLQIANYPFTTLQPQLGILEVDQKQMILADIPGLLPGAWQNRGRGFAFLRHVERTRMLAYVLDLSSKPGFSDEPSPLQQLSSLQVRHTAQLTKASQTESERAALLLNQPCMCRLKCGSTLQRL